MQVVGMMPCGGGRDATQVDMMLQVGAMPCGCGRDATQVDMMLCRWA